ncbi:hypothetical protein IDM40_03240 [Nocardiopsis sp. HNM0947]|uniref:AtuA-like ferredoxin-fold domain-containing protein n=1 Tax=Nocardiopsis coralli TaxID=2772213 RepID=A0ABR9P1K3_9ACTN|nr:hypothetical protein [Nocardiopsis coralli]MBE2997726.1 hypothetical protein [Nocardiopsis coralli]
MNVRLRDIAHARAGDKGNLNTVSVIAREPRWYPVLCEALTTERVRGALADRMRGPLTVHRLDAVHTLVLVFARAPEDTVTTSLHLDTHGKTLATVLLGAEVPLLP